ncbi:DUF3794 and LysM peptidoglycan-binding domain-containing protein [Halothermothrix orenii]|uniref:Peptidoglycan-binding LysM n=1 Tax=Halothermothrix orenii (strain H 168 / OCM 544 / DSM 9562) TaxID=373903 RepID=B8D0F0_HALOH|nr:SPOCS domain-containing protein [Halothermothrix orenii]ACL70886.1 Peptidoglycan-binding LysM [Halothermothrix orenii H 168]
MAINFDEELVRVEYVIGEDTITETITGRIEVPAEKPDILRIIDVKANLMDVEADIEDGGVNITGNIEAGVIYVADVEEPYLPQPVYFTEGQFGFTNFVDFPEAEPGMNVFTDLNIRRVSYDLIDERTIEITVVLTKFVKVTEYRQIRVITDITGIPEENITEELLRIEDVIGENTVTAVITGQVELPPGKPPIQRILNATADLGEVTAEVTEEGVVVDGNIEAGVLYVADVPEGEFQQPVHFLEGEFNFTQAIDVPGAEQGMTVFPSLNILRVSYDFIDEDTVEVDVVIQFFVKVTEPKQVTVITDIVSDRVEVERELLRVEDVIGEQTVHETITGRINIPAAKPDIERILEANARVIEANAMAETGGVMIEGTIQGELLYVADVPEDEFQQPVHFVEGTFNFDNFVDVAGTEPANNVYSEVTVQRVSFDVLNARTAEITAVLRKFVKVTEFVQLEIITDLVVVSPAVEDECPPSYVVYVVQPGDTLYKIARRYRTTVEALLEANPGIDPHNLQIGQKICIPRGIIDARG